MEIGDIVVVSGVPGYWKVQSVVQSVAARRIGLLACDKNGRLNEFNNAAGTFYIDIDVTKRGL